jgi:hypothetical protein
LKNDLPATAFSGWVINEKAGLLIGVIDPGTSSSQGSYPTWSRGIFVYDLKTYKLIDTLGFDRNFYSTIQMTDDGKYFITESKYQPDWTHPENTTRIRMLWESKTLKSIRECPELGIVKLSPNSKYLGSVGLPYTKVYVFDYNTLMKIYDLDPTNGHCESGALDFTSDSKYLVTGGSSCTEAGKYSVWDLTLGKRVYQYIQVLGGSIKISKDKHILSYAINGIGLQNWMLTDDVKEEVTEKNIIYPNPTTNEIIIKNDNIQQGQLSIELNDNTGKHLQILYDGYYNNEELKFNLANFSTGIYFLKVIQNNHTQIIKIIKEN